MIAAAGQVTGAVVAAGIGASVNAMSATAGVVYGTARLAEALTAPRGAWLAGNRAHIAVRGVHRADLRTAAERFARLLAGRDGVRRVELNAVLGRVMVEHDPTVHDLSTLIGLVEALERECGLDEESTAPRAVTHPAALGPPVRAALGLGVNAVGLGYAALGAGVPIPGWLPVSPLLSLIDAAPWLRGVLEASIGRPATDTALTVATAVANAAARRPLGLLVDGAAQFGLYQEAVARRRAWQRWEGDLAEWPGAHRAAPMPGLARPVPLPDGPVEGVANRSAGIALGGYAGVLAATRRGVLASAVLMAGVPKAARAGQDGFAAQVDRDAAARGSLVLEPRMLRWLDRVDTVVLDAEVLLSGRWLIEGVRPVDGGADLVELSERAHDLIDAHDPGRRRERAGWSVAPFAEPATGLPTPVLEAVADGVKRGARMVALRHRGRVAAVVALSEGLDPLAEALSGAARAAGTLLISGVRGGLERRLGAAGVLEGGAGQAEAVRGLQRDGRVVALVGGPNGAGLAAADVGIGLAVPGRAPPWVADVLCRGVGEACALLNAVAPARETSRRVARLSVIASGVGGLLAVLGPAGGAAARASVPVHLAGLLALGMGTWSAMAAARLPQGVPVERGSWHAMSPEAVLAALAGSPAGLAEQEAQRRRKAQPVRAEREELGLGAATMEELANPITPALAAGAGLSASAGSVLDPVLIGTVLALNALIGGAQRLGAQRSLRELTRTSAAAVRVRRPDARVAVSAGDLVPGEIVELNAGDSVPADCRLLSAAGLEVDESSLTGESSTVAKSVRATGARAVADRRCMLYEGTVVAAGRAVGVVVATGERTEAARALRADGGVAPETGVELRLRALTGRILPISLAAGLALIPVDLLRRRPLGQALGRAVSLAVAAVPEGLPFVATVAELAAARRLSARGALVRNPSTVEALGRVDVLCFDKTGTLTEGRISLRGVSDGRGLWPVDDHMPALPRAVLATAVRASPFHLAGEQVPEQTDRAVLEGARRVGVSVEGEWGRVEHLGELPFASDRAYHATLWRDRRGEWISVKGAPEVVLPLCSTWRRANRTVALTAPEQARFTAQVDRLARQGHRILAVAERATPGRSGLAESDIAELELRGMVALADPVRATSARAVATLRAAGVATVIITGDHPSTAESIAAELDALNGRQVLSGIALDELSDDQLDAALPSTAVFARVTPVQKARIVRRLQSAGHAVAVTGDGTNDVPAIRLADVGLALGARATPAAREAADVVITDDRIETITDAIVEGRAMWSSVRDALSILLGGNLGEIAYTFGTALVGGQVALNARQLLLVNLLTDVLPAMSVAVRPPPGATPEQLLEEGPEASLGTALTRDILIRAAITATAASLAWLIARPLSAPGQASTTGLVALVGAQLGQTLAVRGRTPLVLAAVAVSWVLLVAAVQLPGISRIVGSRPLLPHHWAIALTASAAATLAQLLAQGVGRQGSAART
ncbi:MAG TPA: HAD-IC family P-type ATPase [Pseudonocardia sp.]|uniref:cation-translocating P-type ATPase n=1 Tax=Pseudonocardia sp. TaxID=60912 RepID=UPI002ED8A1DC